MGMERLLPAYQHIIYEYCVVFIIEIRLSCEIRLPKSLEDSLVFGEFMV